MTDTQTAPTPAAAGEEAGRPDPRANLVGLARSISEADPTIAVHDIYDQVGSHLYDALGWSGYDTATPVALARRLGGPVLDLACGTGRIGLAVAGRGLAVTGVDLSADMLARYRARLGEEPAEVAERTELIRGDLHTFALDRRYGLAVLGATTIVLVDPARRPAFFERVRHHLRPGGVFAFDFFALDLDQLRRTPLRQSIIELPLLTEGAGYALSCQRFDLRRRVEQVSFVIERVLGPGRSERFIATTAKAILQRDEVVADLIQAGFELVGPGDPDLSTPAGATFDWLLARAPRD